MTEQDWLDASARRLDDARYLLEDGRASTATVQVYYALYYSCRILLERKGFTYHTHTSIVSNVGRLEKYRRRLDTSFVATMRQNRERCDYELYCPDVETVKGWVRRAQSFITESLRLLREEEG